MGLVEAEAQNRGGGVLGFQLNKPPLDTASSETNFSPVQGLCIYTQLANHPQYASSHILKKRRCA